MIIQGQVKSSKGQKSPCKDKILYVQGPAGLKTPLGIDQKNKRGECLMWSKIRLNERIFLYFSGLKVWDILFENLGLKSISLGFTSLHSPLCLITAK